MIITASEICNEVEFSASTSGVCPPPLGVEPPPGCNQMFVEDFDGVILCQDDQDCPQNRNWWIENKGQEPSNIGDIVGFCEDNHCSFNQKGGSCYDKTWCVLDGENNYNCVGFDCNQESGAGGRAPVSVPIAASVDIKSSCYLCEISSCPPDKPCRRGSKCSRPFCTRRGRCWC